jgi:soluble cytochrome b562
MGKGWKQTDEVVTADPKEAERIKQEISILTKRKSNIQGEIDKTKRDTIVVLEEEHKNKLRSLENDYQSKLNSLANDKSSLSSWQETLALKDREQIKKEKELSDRESALQQKESQANILYREAGSLRDSSLQYATDEKERISAKEKLIADREDAVAKRENALAGREFEVENREDSVKIVQQENQDLSLKLVAEDKATSLKDKDLSLLISEAKDKNDKASLLLAEADKINKEAVTLRESIEQKRVDVIKEHNVNKDLAAGLDELRIQLDEKSQTLEEKEKLQIITGRQIDAKISVLNKLRESEK